MLSSFIFSISRLDYSKTHQNERIRDLSLKGT
nr:MAG TPA: hypothetical protein [Caudoviricetes sp.]